MPPGTRAKGSHRQGGEGTIGAKLLRGRKRLAGGNVSPCEAGEIGGDREGLGRNR